MVFFQLVFVFIIGSIGGWLLELFFRRYFSLKKWINPGFLVGPYLPLYGSGLTIMYLLTTKLSQSNFFVNDTLGNLVTITILTVVMTLIEYLTGLIFIKGMRIRLWDYSNQWKNIQGIICPLFTFFWFVLCSIYFLMLHEILYQLVNSIRFESFVIFFIGFFIGVFTIDNVYTFNMASRIRRLAYELKDLVVYENLKKSISNELNQLKKKSRFLFFFSTPLELSKHIKRYFSQKLIEAKHIKEKLEEKIKNK